MEWQKTEYFPGQCPFNPELEVRCRQHFPCPVCGRIVSAGYSHPVYEWAALKTAYWECEQLYNRYCADVNSLSPEELAELRDLLTGLVDWQVVNDTQGVLNKIGPDYRYTLPSYMCRSQYII